MCNWFKGDGKFCEWCRVKRTRMTISSGNTVPLRLVVHSLELRDPVCVIGRRVTENDVNDEGKENLMGLFVLTTLYRPDWWCTLSSLGNLFSLPFTPLRLESCQWTGCLWHDLLSARSLISIWCLVPLQVRCASSSASSCSILYTRNANVTSLSLSRDQPTHLRTRSSIKSCFVGYCFKSHLSPRYGSSYLYFNY